MTDRLLEPLLGGVYAGHARELSFQAVAPDLYWRFRTGGSLLRACRRAGAGAADAGPVFAGLAGGCPVVVDALVADLGAAASSSRRGPPSGRWTATTAGSG